MKLFSKILLLSLFLSGITADSFGQVSFSRKYRVTAYKLGSPQVFSTSNEVEIIPAMSLYIPNTFTPNGDGLNDTFGVAGEAVRDFELQIYNRWGQMIFQTKNANQRWDGTFQGKQVPQGCYVFKLFAQGPKGNPMIKEGSLTVVL